MFLLNKPYSLLNFHSSWLDESKPTNALDMEKPGSLIIRGTAARLQIPHKFEPGQNNHFEGSYEVRAAKSLKETEGSTDALLIFDDENKCFVLERLSAQVSGLRLQNVVQISSTIQKCAICNSGGGVASIAKCAGNCKQAFHFTCLKLSSLPPATWKCEACTAHAKKKKSSYSLPKAFDDQTASSRKRSRSPVAVKTTTFPKH